MASLFFGGDIMDCPFWLQTVYYFIMSVLAGPGLITIICMIIYYATGGDKN